MTARKHIFLLAVSAFTFSALFPPWMMTPQSLAQTPKTFVPITLQSPRLEFTYTVTTNQVYDYNTGTLIPAYTTNTSAKMICRTKVPLPTGLTNISYNVTNTYEYVEKGAIKNGMTTYVPAEFGYKIDFDLNLVVYFSSPRVTNDTWFTDAHLNNIFFQIARFRPNIYYEYDLNYVKSAMASDISTSSLSGHDNPEMYIVGTNGVVLPRLEGTMPMTGDPAEVEIRFWVDMNGMKRYNRNFWAAFWWLTIPSTIGEVNEGR